MSVQTAQILQDHLTEDKAPQVITIDDVPPEDLAMLQALYSRSPASVMSHLDKVRSAGSSKFMSQYYVGYGHASIGDCGFTTVFIENYSMLAAKAIQDNPLYNGQEASTRYLDFSTQPMVDPYQHKASTEILDNWMKLYNYWLPIVKEQVAKQRPFDATSYKNEKIWDNAILARAFDLMRGFLPVGTTTLLSWTTNLRQARDRLMLLKTHPLAEVRQLAQNIFQQLCEKYPNSFNGEELQEDSERYGARDTYNAAQAMREHYQSFENICQQYRLTPQEIAQVKSGEIICRTDSIDINGLNEFESETLKTRPKYGNLPRRLTSYGDYSLVFTLDFGSYRDLQRHRGGHCPLPLIDNTFGFSPWYLSELQKLLSAEHYTQLINELQAQLDKIDQLPQQGIQTTVLLNQYLYPMGMLCPITLNYSVPQMVYVAELRSPKTVHGSLRPIAHKMAMILKENYPDIALYVDMDKEDWTAKRGEQTISAKA